MIKPFTFNGGIAAPFDRDNVDTDLILPAAFMRTVSRKGLGKGLFHALRHNSLGSRTHDFILDRQPWNEATILVTGNNFGCGSSREHAPWALLDFGLRVLIASGFADIFRANCLQNGILTIEMPSASIAQIMATVGNPERAWLSVSLPDQTVTSAERSYSFDINPEVKTALLQGQDEIGRTEALIDEIEAFETKGKAEHVQLRDHIFAIVKNDLIF